MYRRFWQPFLYNPIRSHASFLTHELLSIPRTIKAARYIKIFIAFILSGMIHILASFAVSGLFNYRGDLLWAMTQIIGLGVEDLVLALVKAYTPIAARREVTEAIGGKLGFLWVLTFLVWSIPKWRYRGLYKRWDSLWPRTNF